MEPTYMSWLGQPLLDGEGARFGTIEDVFVNADDEPVWLEARSAGSGRSVLVPLAGSRPAGAGMQVVHASAAIESAPPVSTSDGPSAEDQQALLAHYAAPAPAAGRGRSRPAPNAAPAPAPQGAEVVRAEEELRVHTEMHPAGRVRLRKWVETQTVTEEVTLHKEHVRLDREPVSLASTDVRIRNAEIGEAEYEVWLRDEHVVASKVIVPREVVRLSKDVVQETLLVEADLRHEEVAVEEIGRQGIDDGLAARS